MPGRIRQEGIELYEKGQLAVERVQGQLLFLQIAGEHFRQKSLEASAPPA